MIVAPQFIAGLLSAVPTGQCVIRMPANSNPRRTILGFLNKCAAKRNIFFRSYSEFISWSSRLSNFVFSLQKIFEDPLVEMVALNDLYAIKAL